MTMSKPGLKSELQPEIKAKLEALFSIVPGLGDQWLTDFSDAMAEAIANKVIDHITANAVVTSVTSTPFAAPGAVTLPGTATGTIA